MARKDFNSNVGLMNEQWQCLKEDLHNGVVEYDDLEKIINKYMVFNRFDNVFQETCKFFEVSLSDIKTMYRGVSGEIDLNNYERMIPKVEFAKGNYRMNPPGKAFLYAGVLGNGVCQYSCRIFFFSILIECHKSHSLIKATALRLVVW